MNKRIGQIVVECIFDLGITVVYATFAGLLIVAVVASDDGPISFQTGLLYASLLPGAVTMLIGIDLVLRFVEEKRASRKRRPTLESLDRRANPLASEHRTCLQEG